MKKTAYYHFLLGLFPVLFVFGHNFGQGEIQFSDLIVPSIVVLVLAFVFSCFFSFLAKDKHKGAILASVFLLYLLSYGHGYTIINGFIVFKHRVFLSISVVVLALLTYFIFRVRRGLLSVTLVLNIVSLSMLIMPLNSIVIGMVHSAIEEKDFRESKRYDDFYSDVSVSAMPDIYYIIIDSYVANSTLKHVYDYDNREFTEYLREKGFRIASRSRSNYSSTFLSLASSLNMEYINYLKYMLGSSNDLRILYSLVRDNKVKDFLKSKGYRIMHFGMWWDPGNVEQNAGFDLHKDKHFSAFALVLMEKSILNIFYDYYFASIIKNVTYNTFEAVAKVPELPGPHFVFAYFYGLHPPFVFGPKGEDISAYQAVEASKDKVKWKKLYLSQLSFYNSQIEKLIDQILSKSRISPIIVLQADHGVQFEECSRENFKECIQERMRNLNAYYLPNKGADILYDSITPVNSFRLIFKHYFGVKINLLEDYCYYSEIRHPWIFTDVTDFSSR